VVEAPTHQSTAKPGIVIAQNPHAGTRMRSGSPVQLTIGH
jgi:beta-lactam-binding protein with PASTA domain